MAFLRLENVCLTFNVRQSGRVTLKEYIVKQLFRRTNNPVLEVRALQNVSLDLKTGTRLGIIGNNGAGKSSLLKLLAGVYPPSTGQRTVEGKISSLFDITLGFEMEASGWENIAYRSYLQGESPTSIKPKLKAIAEFSELGDFLSVPVKCYSSGMLMRLAFSIATAIEPEILLIDEVLSVGDRSFQEKARRRMNEMLRKARLIVMVSHDLDSLGKVCDQVLWLERGEMKALGPADQILSAYRAQPTSAPMTAAA